MLTVVICQYMGANCEGASVPTLKDNLLGHHHMTSLAYWHEILGSQLAELGVSYVLGETNSISVSSPLILSLSSPARH